MNLNETKSLLNTLGALFPSFAPSPEAAGSWQEVFADCPANGVREALKRFAKTAKGFAPTPGELFALLPKGSVHHEEMITWAADGGSYTITRNGESRTYQCTPIAEKWLERKKEYARGYGYCIEKRPRGWATYYLPLTQCSEIGEDWFHGEMLPRFEAKQ